jgi:hypothetical protein
MHEDKYSFHLSMNNCCLGFKPFGISTPVLSKIMNWKQTKQEKSNNGLCLYHYSSQDGDLELMATSLRLPLYFEQATRTKEEMDEMQSGVER